MTSVSLRRTGLTLAIFVVLAFLIYSNTFNASFHYDDSHEAIAHFSEALRIKPDYVQARRNLLFALGQAEKVPGYPHK